MLSEPLWIDLIIIFLPNNKLIDIYTILSFFSHLLVWVSLTCSWLNKRYHYKTKDQKTNTNYQVDDPPEILMACTRTPKVSARHQHSIQSDLQDFHGVRDSTSTPQQETLCFPAIHSCQVA